MTINVDEIPQELKILRQWVCWKTEQREGKNTKVPYIANMKPSDSTKASVDNPKTWCSLESALQSVNKKFHDGIGFVFTKQNQYSGIDLDKCRNAETGEIESWALDIIKRIDSYTEISQSLRGIHIIVKAGLPEGSGNRKGNFEIYNKGRFFCMTGDVLYGSKGIEERQEQVNQVCSEIFKKLEPESKPSREPSTSNLSDQEIIEKASKANYENDVFNRLYFQGDISLYDDDYSIADYHLAKLLAFWTQKDIDQIERIMRMSALQRDKWDKHKTYLRKLTIQEAINNTTEVYNPGWNHSSINKSSKAVDPVVEETQSNHSQQTKAEPVENKESDPSRYFADKKFIPSRLADELMSEFDFIYCTGELYLYQRGVYRPIGEVFIKRECRERLKEGARINSINEVISHIKDYSDINVDQLNTHKFLINLNNGMYDISNEKLLPHSKDYLSTIRIPVNHDPSVSYSDISDWLESTLIDPDCIQLACELFGYCLIPDCTMAKAFMLVGSGANGKSTLLTVLENFIGKDNVSKIPLQELADHRFKRAELFGKLVNLFADLDNRALESTSYFKTIVTGDSIDAERKNQNPFSFRPYARLVFSANEIPRSRDRSFAYYRRWCIIPFERQFVDTDDKKGLADELSKTENLTALLNCALSELKDIIKRQSFSEPKKVKEALNEYEKQNDPVKAFVDECCKLDPLVRIERGSLYDSFCTYCNETGFKAVTRNIFYQRLRTFREIRELRDSEKRMFEGIKLNAD